MRTDMQGGKSTELGTNMGTIAPSSLVIQFLLDNKKKSLSRCAVIGCDVVRLDFRVAELGKGITLRSFGPLEVDERVY